MLNPVHSLLFGAVPARFESRLGWSKSVERLQRATRRSAFGAISCEEAVGQVSANAVALRRVIPFVRNPFKPCFVGRFERSEGGVVLVGRFTIHWAVKSFTAVWFGFCLLWMVLLTVVVASSAPVQWAFALFGVAMLVAGALLVLLGTWLARSDVAWLARVIESALSGENGS